MKETRPVTYSPSAGRKPLNQYRYFLPAIAGWLIFVVLFFLLKHLIEPRYLVHCALDDLIPFVKWFFIAYCFWYFYLLGASLYLGIKAKQEFILQQKFYFLGLGFTLLLYLILPNGIAFRPAVAGNDPLSLLIAYVFLIDSPTMVFPSMHVFCAAATHLALARHWRRSGNRLPAALSFLVMALICLSTVFVKQHSVLDVAGGLVLAGVLYLFCTGERNSSRKKQPLKQRSCFSGFLFRK